MILLVGLGNPGKEYERTRHNIGWRVLDAYAASLEVEFTFEKKWNALIAKQNDVILCKPQTFMNNSGQAVRAVADYFKIEPHRIIVVHDDKDLQFGTIRMRSEGSSAGHNGVQSIIEHMGVQEFPRMRVGVMNDQPLPDTADFVLQRFSNTEEQQIDAIMSSCVEYLADALQQPSLEHQDIVVDLST